MQATPAKTNGQFIELNQERFYLIENVDAMPAFFMSIVSHSDHWLFISSNTGLTAGRVSANSALFPYEAVDKIEDNAEYSGNKAIFRILTDTGYRNWEPFNSLLDGTGLVKRNLYKHVLGSQLCFEETHLEFNLTYRFTWQMSDEFGFVIQSELINHNDTLISLEVLDGLQNILPAGAPTEVQTNASNLVDAYRCNERLSSSGLGIFSLYSGITDKPEPFEVLNANTVFQIGLENPKTLLSSRQLKSFRTGQRVQQEDQVRGIRGAYLVVAPLKLDAKAKTSWKFIANVEQTQNQIAELDLALAESPEKLNDAIDSSVKAGINALRNLLAKTDAFQYTASEMSDVHHYSNVLFNAMRGGVFDNHYWINTADFIHDIKHFNQPVYETRKAFLTGLPETILLFELEQKISELNDTQLTRLFAEYLPITFGRRHGDPSRPWNKFAIKIKDEHGDPLLSYEGNWRDIFQNWEALLLSYPEFTENVISKFVNASTIDGYNPYRITKKGIDWEIEDPKDPWSYIGYWGDHQIIYLLKLLELSNKYHPEKLGKLLSQPLFSYANVPYRIKAFSALLSDPKNTVVYDEQVEDLIHQRVSTMGADGKLVLNSQDQVYQVNLLEKLLVPLLAKLSNFVVRGGIWLNTQRPEWNDANNALVGQGLSMVTLYYMRRYVAFLLDLLASSSHDNSDFDCSNEVVAWFNQSATTLKQACEHLNQQGDFSDAYRFEVLTALGQAASTYRHTVYDNKGFSGQEVLNTNKLSAMLNNVLVLLDDSIQFNQASNQLFHAYNLLNKQDESVSVDYLYDMLEGQVSALSAGTLGAQQTINVLEGLFDSEMYRQDQKTFMLYPDEVQTPFLEKNRIKTADLESNPHLMQLLAIKNQTLLVKDCCNQGYRFHPEISNVNVLVDRINPLHDVIGQSFDLLKTALVNLYEQSFNHKSFTGRSHGMFGFEGLGCIYWHMVSKLLLATQENYFKAIKNHESADLVERLGELYYQVREGIGFNKTPTEYGAFPYDPYSHTPMHSGAQQPGMTGQVKEEVLTRYGELGVNIKEGVIDFNPTLLRRKEFSAKAAIFEYLTLSGKTKTIDLAIDSLAFTLCQVPIVYILTSGVEQMSLESKNGEIEQVNSLTLSNQHSESIFKRTGEIIKIEVHIDEKNLLF